MCEDEVMRGISPCKVSLFGVWELLFVTAEAHLPIVHSAVCAVMALANGVGGSIGISSSQGLGTRSSSVASRFASVKDAASSLTSNTII
jgi:hypothetical protein